MTKRKKDYPKRGGGGGNRRAPGGPEEVMERPNLATINMEAGAGKAGLTVGDKVVIGGRGLYTGETATIERLSTGAIPSAVVRTSNGQTRHVRTIDLQPARAEQSAGPTAEAAPQS